MIKTVKKMLNTLIHGKSKKSDNRGFSLNSTSTKTIKLEKTSKQLSQVCRGSVEAYVEVPRSVMKLISEILEEDFENSPFDDTFYNRIVDFIIKNSTEDNLPKNKILRDEFNLSGRELNSVKARLVNENIILKVNPTTYKLRR